VGERDWLIQSLLQELDQDAPELAEKLEKRILEGVAENAEALGNYAIYFAREGRLDAAAAFYKRAVEADPKHASNLGNYAGFLWNRKRFEEAEAFYKRAVEADPKGGNHLGNYALFLANRERFEEAEAFYKRALEADPKDADHLGYYANFLKNRERFEDAEAFYKRAIEADPKHANHLGNYGQFLVGVGRLQEGEDKLLQSFEHLVPSERGARAEVCFSLWLVIRMQRRDATGWERRFMFLIKQGFKRYPWDFDRMLRQAEKLVTPEELEYAKALAAAFLDEAKVADLAKYPQWQALEPLDPKAPLAGVAS
jgi:Tfp pilus assembly protein PilF